MIQTATKADGAQIQDITARTGFFNAEEVECVGEIFDEYINDGAEVSGYHFLVDKEGDKVLGFACYGWRDLTEGVYDLFWIAVDPQAQRNGTGRRLSEACEEAVRKLGGRMLIAETSGTDLYESTRRFYLGTGYVNEASIKDFYKPGDDLNIFVKRI